MRRLLLPSSMDNMGSNNKGSDIQLPLLLLDSWDELNQELLLTWRPPAITTPLLLASHWKALIAHSPPRSDSHVVTAAGWG
jgi:hypothetical protein